MDVSLNPSYDDEEPMFTILPHFFFFISIENSFENKNGALILISKQESKSSTNDLDNNFTDNVPAQLIKISQFLIVFLNFLIIFFISFGFLKSHILQ